MNRRTVSADIEIEVLVESYPEVIPILTKRGIICIQCGAPVWGTLGEAIIRAGQNVEQVVNMLNEVVSV
ncbi:MAG: DUF1858 domain-containing protein [Calditrichaeota bacterium]|nr:DUF1858 domain-containing protein [Calditrichota bacterium]